jgi:hypothetical protein
MSGDRAVKDIGTVVNANNEVWPASQYYPCQKGKDGLPCHPDQSLTSRTLPMPPSLSLNTLNADFGPFFLLENKPLFSDRAAATMTRSSKTNMVNDSSLRLVLLEEGDRWSLLTEEADEGERLTPGRGDEPH